MAWVIAITRTWRSRCSRTSIRTRTAARSRRLAGIRANELTETRLAEGASPPDPRRLLAFTERLAALPIDGRSVAWDGFRAGRPDRDDLIRAARLDHGPGPDRG